MPIPPLNEHGLLAPGIHECTFSELEAMFGQNRWLQDPQSESRRETLCPNRGRLCERLADLHRVGLDVEVLVDGSFVTDKPDPNDLDLIVVLPPGHDFTCELPLREYNLLSKRRLRESGYPFDVFVVARGDSLHTEALGLFRQVRDRPDLTKGLLRVKP
jgi:hypothetical protein